MESSKKLAVSPVVQQKLVESRMLAQSKQLRNIRCPVCGFYLLDVYGQGHYLIRVKCRKCKFNETIDTALFRTLQRRLQAQHKTK